MLLAILGITAAGGGKNGPYSDGYYADGLINLAYNNVTPQYASDDSLAYTYASGVATTANGAYSNGYYTNGSIDGSYYNFTPQTVLDNNNYYVYNNGNSYLVNGLYSNGYYADGLIDLAYNNGTPQIAIDTSLYYTYASGVATTANGAYSNGYYTNGSIDGSYTNLVPSQSQDDSLYYTYSGGSAAQANGAYSTGYYTNGSFNVDAYSSYPDSAIDDGNWYMYAAGVPSLAPSTGVYDIDQDSNDDEWSFVSNQLVWNKIILHPNQYDTQFVSFWSDNAPLNSGVSIVYTDSGTAGQLLVNASGVALYPNANNSTTEDEHSWSTDGNGIISFVKIIAHEYSHSLGGSTYYSNDQTLINGQSLIYAGDGTAAPYAANLTSGVQDMDGNGADDDWIIDMSGAISWTETIAYTNSMVLGGNSYYYNGTLDTGTVLYTGTASNAATAGEASGTYDFNEDGNPDSWSIDSSGVITITISSRNSVSFNSTTYYYDGNLVSMSTILYTGVTGFDTPPYINSQQDNLPPEDIDGDGRTEIYEVGPNGVPGLLFFADAIVHPYIVNFGFAQDTTTSTSGSTILYTSEYSDAATAAANTGMGYIGGESGLKDWSINANGVLSWSQHVLVNSFTIGSSTYYHDGTLTNGSTQVYADANGTAYGTGSGEYDFGDGNAAWSISGYNGGVITWTVISHTTSIQFDVAGMGNTTFYYDGLLTSGATVLYTSSTSNAVGNNLGGSYNFGEGQANWTTDGNGVISWSLAINHPYGYTFSGPTTVYADDSTIIPGSTVLYTASNTNDVWANQSGDQEDFDGDQILDSWSTDGNGVISYSLGS